MTIVFICAHSLYQVDKADAKEKGKHIYYAGTVIQGYFLYIVIRDVIITLNHFIKGHRSAFAIVIFAHYFISCLDNLLLTGVTIWGTIALNSDEAEVFSSSPEKTGLPNFISVTTFNVVMAYIYVIVHVCACPISIFIVARDPERFGIRVRRAEDLDDDELNLMNN